MVSRPRILIVASGVLCLMLVMVPGVAAGDPCYHGYTIPPTTSAATTTVSLEPCAFVPTAAHVAPGATVTFDNVSDMPHLVVGANASWGDRDAELAAGAARTVRFDRPGIYPFSCALHRGMTGVIVVGEPDMSDVSAAAASSTTAGTDQAVLLAMSGLGALAVVGWAVAFLQRRRGNASQEQAIRSA
jgi:plastocyanin